jgi:hypothetical protein
VISAGAFAVEKHDRNRRGGMADRA